MANTNQDALRMVTRARSHLLLDFPLWGVSVLGMDLKEDDAVGTLATDGQSLFYCPAYILGLSHKALIFWLAHEAAHVWLLHHTRRCGRDLMQWNIAADYAINPLRVAAGVGELPPGALLDPAMFDSAEKNYKLLTDRAEENKRPDDGDGAGDDNGGGSADGCADPGDDAGGPGDGSAGGDDTDGGGDPGDGSGDDAGDGSTGGGGDSRDDTGADDTGAGGGGAPAPGAETYGGGGTDFVPVFEWVADNMAGQDIAGLTYFTDLECWSYPAMVPGFPVLWACFGDSWEDDIYRGAVPFGDVVGIDD